MKSYYVDLNTNFLNVGEQVVLFTGKYRVCNTALGKSLIGNDAMIYVLTVETMPVTAEERLEALKSAWIVKPGEVSDPIKLDANEILIAVAPQGETSMSITEA